MAKSIRHHGFHVLIALALTGKAAAVTNEVFAIVPGYKFWPFLLVATGVTVLASSLTPFNYRMHAFAGAMLVGTAALRITTYVIALTSGELSSGATAIAWYLIFLWAVVLALGAVWDRASGRQYELAVNGVEDES